MMKMKTTLSTAACLFAGLWVSFAALAMEAFPEVSAESLDKLQDTDLALVYAQPDADLRAYKRIWLADATVAFKRNWQRDQNRPNPFKVKSEDMERIKSDLTKLFREVFTEKLTQGGYTLAEAAGDDVLIVRPAIVDLDIVAPDTDTAMRTYQFARSAGGMALYLELYDSRTGELIAQAMDRKKDREHVFFQRLNRVTNRAAVDRILSSWARTLSKTLEEARGVAGES